MTGPSATRQIVLDMEPLFRDLRNGVDAAVVLSRSERFDADIPNGLVFVVDELEELVVGLSGLWRDLAAATESQPTTPTPPLKAVAE